MVLHGIDPHSNANPTTHITTNAPQNIRLNTTRLPPWKQHLTQKSCWKMIKWHVFEIATSRNLSNAMYGRNMNQYKLNVELPPMFIWINERGSARGPFLHNLVKFNVSTHCIVSNFLSALRLGLKVSHCPLSRPLHLPNAQSYILYRGSSCL